MKRYLFQRCIILFCTPILFLLFKIKILNIHSFDTYRLFLIFVLFIHFYLFVYFFYSFYSNPFYLFHRLNTFSLLNNSSLFLLYTILYVRIIHDNTTYLIIISHCYLTKILSKILFCQNRAKN